MRLIQAPDTGDMYAEVLPDESPMSLASAQWPVNEYRLLRRILGVGLKPFVDLCLGSVYNPADF